MIIPFVFMMDPADYYGHLWIFYKFLQFAVEQDTPIIAQERYFVPPAQLKDRGHPHLRKDVQKKMGYTLPDADTLRQKSKYQFNEANIERLIKDHGSQSDAWIACLRDEIPWLVDYFGALLERIEKEEKKEIEGILSFIFIPSLSAAAKKRDIPVIYNELNLRDPNYYKIAYFDFHGLQHRTELEENYRNFLLNGCHEALPMLDRETLLALFLLPGSLYKLSLLRKEPEYQIGIAAQQNYNYLALPYGYCSNYDLIREVSETYADSDVLYRPHPLDPVLLRQNVFQQDAAETSLEFVVNCRHVVAFNSNIIFEAMLWGRTAHSYQKSAFWGQTAKDITDKTVSMADISYLNFCLFGYFAPYDLIYDAAYIKWRLSKPGTEEIYRYHLKYILDINGVEEEALALPETERALKIMQMRGYDPIGRKLQCITESDELIKMLSRLAEIEDNNRQQRVLMGKLLVGTAALYEAQQNIIYKNNHIAALEESQQELISTAQSQSDYIRGLETQRNDILQANQRQALYVGNLESESRRNSELLQQQSEYIKSLEYSIHEKDTQLSVQEQLKIYADQLENRNRWLEEELDKNEKQTEVLKNRTNEMEEELTFKRKQLEITTIDLVNTRKISGRKERFLTKKRQDDYPS